MSSPPSDRSLEGLIADFWGDHAVRPDIVTLLEPFRESSEYIADDFDPDAQSWRDYLPNIFGSAIPEKVMTQVADMLAKPAPAVVHEATSPIDWRAVYELAAPVHGRRGVERAVLITDSVNARENGMWLVSPGGSRRHAVVMKKTPEGMVRVDPLAEHKERRARCVDDKLDEVLTGFGFFLGDRVEVEEGILMAYRAIGPGREGTYTLGEAYDSAAVVAACARWFFKFSTQTAKAARAFAVERHGDQLYGDEPYVVHLDAVHAILNDLGLADGPLGAAAYLHDVVEDTRTGRHEIRARFGPTVERLVWAVTKPAMLNRSDGWKNSAAKIREEGVFAANLKIADRTHNVRRSKPGTHHLATYTQEQPSFVEELAGLGDQRLWDMLAASFT